MSSFTCPITQKCIHHAAWSLSLNMPCCSSQSEYPMCDIEVYCCLEYHRTITRRGDPTSIVLVDFFSVDTVLFTCTQMYCVEMVQLIECLMASRTKTLDAPCFCCHSIRNTVICVDLIQWYTRTRLPRFDCCNIFNYLCHLQRYCEDALCLHWLNIQRVSELMLMSYRLVTFAILFSTVIYLTLQLLSHLAAYWVMSTPRHIVCHANYIQISVVAVKNKKHNMTVNGAVCQGNSSAEW